jgi:hypothetical protein
MGGIMKTTKLEEWRVENGMTYAEMANILGTSRTYAFKVCQNGVAGVAKLLKLVALSKGTLSLEDLLSYEDREKLASEGFLRLDGELLDGTERDEDTSQDFLI